MFQIETPFGYPERVSEERSQPPMLMDNSAPKTLCLTPTIPLEAASVPMLRAVEEIRRMRGGCQSHLMRCSDDNYYVVKFPEQSAGEAGPRQRTPMQFLGGTSVTSRRPRGHYCRKRRFGSSHARLVHSARAWPDSLRTRPVLWLSIRGRSACESSL